MRTSLSRSSKLTWYHIWGGGFLGISHASSPRSGVQALTNLEFLAIYPYVLCRRTTEFDVVTHVGRGVYFGVSHASHLKKGEFQGSPILDVVLYFMPTLFTQNCDIRHGNIIWGGDCFQEVSHGFVYLHKWVVRFVVLMMLLQVLWFLLLLDFALWSSPWVSSLLWSMSTRYVPGFYDHYSVVREQCEIK